MLRTLASSKSIWVNLSVVVLPNIFGSAIKSYRAILLQVKEELHIEAARACGASDRRIILRHLVPRIVPILIPSYIFLEAMPAYLGVSNPGPTPLGQADRSWGLPWFVHGRLPHAGAARPAPVARSRLREVELRPRAHFPG